MPDTTTIRPIRTGSTRSFATTDPERQGVLATSRLVRPYDASPRPQVQALTAAPMGAPAPRSAQHAGPRAP